MTDRTVRVRYEAEYAKFVDGHNRMSAASKQLADRAEKDADRVRSGWSALSKTTAAAAVGLLSIGKAAEFLRASVDAASSLQQATLKSAVIFGRAAGDVDKWAKSADSAFGLSERAAKEAAANFGDMFSQIGFGAEAARGMSKSVVQMAADLGSFNNLRTDDVLERIAAGFRGEYDSLQKVIPNISAMRIETEALAQTGKKTAQTLTAQEKATALLAIISKDGARATGDFARSQGTLAIEQQKAAAKAENMMAVLGGKLLPVMTAAAQVAQHGADAIVGLVQAVDEIPGPVKAAVAALVAFHLLHGPVGSMASAVGGFMRSLGEAMGYAHQAAVRAGGGFAGLRVGLQTFTGSASLARGAASGLLGVLGGPWGIAITGAAVVLGMWASKQAEARARVEAHTDALDKQTGALTDNNRALAVNNLEQSGALEVARKMGISLREVTDAATGSAPAWERINAQMIAWSRSQQEAGAKQAEVIEPIKTLSNAIGREAGEVNASSDAWRRKSEALGQSTDAQRSATAATDAGTDATNKAVDALREHYLAQQKLKDGFADARGAERDYEAALDALTESVKKNGDTLDIHTEKGRTNEEALYRIAETATAAAKAQLSQGDSVEQAARVMDARRATFIEQATRLLGSKAAAEQLADKLGLTRGKVESLSSEIAKMPTVKTIRFDVDMVDAMIALGKLKSAASIRGVLKMAAANEAHQAEGSIRINGVKKMAAGGFAGRPSMIMTSQAPILWNEAPGGEAYISLAPQQRSRSLRLWQETGRLLGVGAASPSVSVQWPSSGVSIRGALSVDLARGVAELIDARITQGQGAVNRRMMQGG